MTLVLLALITALVLAIICRGRPSTFRRPQTRRLGLLGLTVVAFATAPLSKSAGLAVGWLVVAGLTMLWFGLLNRGRPGIGLMLAGLFLNCLVYMLNGGMPVSLAAVDRAGVPLSRVALDTSALREELTDTTVLPWLGEAIPLALPIRPAVASPGDVLLAAGVALFIFTGLTGFGREVPAALLSPKEKRKLRKKQRFEAKAEAAAQAADAALRPDDRDELLVPATISAETVVATPGAGSFASVPPSVVPADESSSAAGEAPDDEVAPDPAALAAAAEAARAEVERKKLQRQIKQMKKARKQLKRQAAPVRPVVPAVPVGEDAATDLAGRPVTPATSIRPGLSVVPPVSTNDWDDEDDEDDDDIALTTPSARGPRRAGSPVIDAATTATTGPAINPSNDRLA